ncbi:hypothetical protein [Actinomadura violacea]|uniref:Uncharacterized protein n=1 Tax=Actinomadura violacea TaxID=2819934 RepID=A0ABS3RQY8_9ACTN|nr:hypothetical protein [Actinomadura violacea]MBO2459147.1 hypothetical protein [Actinomadura violacea]
MSETDDLEREPLPEDANEADTAEQRADLDEDAEETTEWAAQLPMDVNEADAAEQHREIPLDDDDYR